MDSKRFAAIQSQHKTLPNMMVSSGSEAQQAGLDKLPPLPPSSTTNSGNKTAGGHLRLGGLSRYLMEKVQSNDSGLDLSPGTIQNLVHPLRSSGSSTSSLSSSRTLFESPASSDESPAPASKNEPVQTPSVSRSILSEQSHNSSETTVIEKTLTDDTTSADVNSKRLGSIPEKYVPAAREPKKAVQMSHLQSHVPPSTYAIPDDVTPKGRGEFQIPAGYPDNKVHRRGTTTPVGSNCCNENSDPAGIAAVIPPRGSAVTDHHPVRKALHTPKPTAVTEHQVRKDVNTPKPKLVKKKQLPTPAKKQTDSGWKFMSEHVQKKEYLILKQLGKGGSGEVSLVMEKYTNNMFALKVVKLHGIDEALVQECINEVEMLIDLKGTDLVVEIHSWEFNRAEKTMKIVMEYGDCDLNRFLSKVDRTLRKIHDIWERLLKIVDTIHSRGIVHADLKPANFVMVEGRLKIIDFGIASRLQSDLTSIAMSVPKGTLNFISPETIRLDDAGRSKLSPKSDIWALGCILYLMVYGRTPFEHISHPVTKMNAIAQGDIAYPVLPPHLQGSEVISVLKLCFQTDYRKRPSAADLLNRMSKDIRF